jgi:hypothetical protein
LLTENYLAPASASTAAISAATIVSLSLRSRLIHSVIPAILVTIVIVIAVLRVEPRHSIDATNTTRAAHAINTANSTNAAHAVDTTHSTDAAHAINTAHSTYTTNSTNTANSTYTPRFRQSILINLPRAVSVVPTIAVGIKIIPVVIVPPTSIGHAPTPSLRPRV